MNLQAAARILIADDYATGRALLTLHLTSCGYQVEQASDGRMALEMARSGDFDLLLLDIEMPEMNGLEVLREVRAQFTQAQLPVIMISARDESPDVVAAFAAGANDYVTKPIELAITEARVRAQLLVRFAASQAVPVPELSGVGTVEGESERLDPGEIELGTMLGAYRLDEVLGRGAMGVVYLAENETLERPVALKVLAANFEENSQALARFQREAKLAAKIEHPNVVGIYEVGKWQGRHFLAMQLVRGESLADRLEREERLSEDEARRIITEVAQGLAAAHAHGIIHRDIKPSNILLSDQRAKLADFGLAKPRDPLKDRLTQTHMLMGTPEFMSPEVFAEKELEPQSDIYALGVTWFMLLTGLGPFHDSETLMDLAMAHLQKSAPDVRDLAPHVAEATARLISRMLSKEPADRPADAVALLAEIDGLDPDPG